MFTGIIDETGRVVQLRKTAFGGVLKISSNYRDIGIGESVAVNGACLTVVDFTDGVMSFELSPETFKRTNLGSLKKNEPVNLERSLRADSRLGGHFVLGHVDFTARILRFAPRGKHRELVIGIPADQLKFFVEKGSVAVDGISLTVNYIKGNSISINIIPHTYENTNLRIRKPGDLVNVEVDIIGKYVANFVRP